jgi:hypothetical protein
MAPRHSRSPGPNPNHDRRVEADRLRLQRLQADREQPSRPKAPTRLDLSRGCRRREGKPQLRIVGKLDDGHERNDSLDGVPEQPEDDTRPAETRWYECASRQEVCREQSLEDFSHESWLWCSEYEGLLEGCTTPCGVVASGEVCAETSAYRDESVWQACVRTDGQIWTKVLLAQNVRKGEAYRLQRLKNAEKRELKLQSRKSYPMLMTEPLTHSISLPGQEQRAERPMQTRRCIPISHNRGFGLR